MTLERLLKALYESTDIVFDFNGKTCGIFPLWDGNKTTYHLWYGDEEFILKNVDHVLSYPAFNGKSMTDIFRDVEIDLQ